SGGASQETYRITVVTEHGERPVAMRRAPGGVPGDHPTAPGLAVEAELMTVAGAHGVPEPEVYRVLDDADGLGKGFVMEWLDGVTLGARINRAPELDAIRPRLAYQCGEILARIHAIDLDASGLRSRLHTLPTDEFIELMWERYRGYETPQPMIDFAARWLVEHQPADVEPTLVHNDFRNGNIMVGPEGVVAVLDWEVAHIGDPMRDLGWICTNSWRFGGDGPVGGFGSYEDLFAGYESVSGRPVDAERVRFWEVFGSFWWAVGCLGMAEHYRNGPDRTVERPGIGRRSSECQVDCVNLIIPGPVHLIEPSGPVNPHEMPRVDELLVSVRDFLHGDVMAATEGRTNFLARVAGNSLDIVLRDLHIGPELRAREAARLRQLLGDEGDVRDDLDTLRWRLVHELRDGTMALDRAGLVEYLREAVVNQVAIDQPRYAGYRTAVANSGEG
ncbi:MAG: phosphotransferase family protein, partial [Acidimicrobiia bacterium]|nr:phosphotransferase family protein [Acidimicrobiia bacterium]